jgi:hypothetical protein
MISPFSVRDSARAQKEMCAAKELPRRLVFDVDRPFPALARVVVKNYHFYARSQTREFVSKEYW